VTRSGQRVKLDCGGKRCGAWSSSSSECDSNESDDDSSEDEREYRARQRREAEKGAPAPTKGRSGVEEKRRGVVVERRRR